MLSMGFPSWAQRQMPWRTHAQQIAPQPIQPSAPQPRQQFATQPMHPPAPLENGDQPRVIDERDTPPAEYPQETGESSMLEQQLMHLNMSSEEFDWRVDWWKYLIIAVVFIAVLLVLLRVGKALLRLLAFVACVAFSSFFAYYIGPLCAPWLLEKCPQLDMPQIPILYWSYGLVFLIAYLVAIIILRIIKRPFDITAPKKHEGK